jgi:hypothetical protein
MINNCRENDIAIFQVWFFGFRSTAADFWEKKCERSADFRQSRTCGNNNSLMQQFNDQLIETLMVGVKNAACPEWGFRISDC